MEARSLCSYNRGRHALWSGQQRLWRRSVLTTADIPDADRENTELQPYLFSIGRRGSVWQRRHQPSLASLAKIDLAIVGEPTGMQPAVAEKGLMVLDVIAHGKADMQPETKE